MRTGHARQDIKDHLPQPCFLCGEVRRWRVHNVRPNGQNWYVCKGICAPGDNQGAGWNLVAD